jgi:uncharacterized membrane protein YfcA
MSQSSVKEAIVSTENSLLPILINASEKQWLIVGGKTLAYEKLSWLLNNTNDASITIVAPMVNEKIRELSIADQRVNLVEKEYDQSDLEGVQLLITTTDNDFLNQRIKDEASLRNILVYIPNDPLTSDFSFPISILPSIANGNHKKVNKAAAKNSDQRWKRIASRSIIVFALMVIGHLIISYLPLPPLSSIWHHVEPYFDFKFLFFVLAGFLAQMVDGVLGMGYGVTSATCLMAFGVNPVAMSAAIHTSEIFTTGVSGYSHYKFGNVNKKLFKHLAIPGIIGAVLGAVLLVILGEKAGKWLLPIIALYAGLLGLRILLKAFQNNSKNKKIKRIGWLAWAGGFLDSFGGGGWGPIVTSSLIAKGRSPRFTVGSVSLSEFFVTLASAFTFFMTVGVSHWNIVLGLLIGGSTAAPFAAKLTGKLPRKTMMIGVGIMVIIWCVRMIVKSF